MNKRLRVMTIFGTRPEAIKLAPVINQLVHTPQVESLVCVTAQHRQMLDQVLDLFKIVPDIDLDLMKPSQSLPGLTADVITHLDPVLANISPDWILVQGDTTTVMAASILAYYHRIQLGHVEAGLRTADKWQPFPEEINRRVTSVLADLHFAPTDWSRQNLIGEGIPPDAVFITGNPVIDALRTVADLPLTTQVQDLFADLQLSEFFQPSLSPGGDKIRLVLVTAHRRENFGEPLRNICRAIIRLASTYGDAIRIVYPVHLNPNVQEPVNTMLKDIPNVFLVPPLDYLPFIQLMRKSALILTDSGGLQEEAPYFGIPVLVMRALTERPEGVEAGTVKLVGTDPDRIFSEAGRLLDDPQAYLKMSQAVNPYGDGYAAQRIVSALLANQQ